MGIRLPFRGPFGLRLLQPVEPLIERFEPRVWWKLRDLVGIVLSHVSPLCVAPAETLGGQARTRNMAESGTAKAPPLYERGWR
jgi:hypothetical protein